MVMVTGNPKAWGAALLLAILAAGCGSGGGEAQTQAPPPSLSAHTADELAKKSDEVAAAIDAGDTCGAAHKADELAQKVEDSDIPADLRPDVEAGAAQLVDTVNCPPPPKPKKNEEHGGEHGHDEGDQGYGDAQLGPLPAPPGQGGHLPPGHQDDAFTP